MYTSVYVCELKLPWHSMHWPFLIFLVALMGCPHSMGGAAVHTSYRTSRTILATIKGPHRRARGWRPSFPVPYGDWVLPVTFKLTFAPSDSGPHVAATPILTFLFPTNLRKPVQDLKCQTLNLSPAWHLWRSLDAARAWLKGSWALWSWNSI